MATPRAGIAERRKRRRARVPPCVRTARRAIGTVGIRGHRPDHAGERSRPPARLFDRLDPGRWPAPPAGTPGTAPRRNARRRLRPAEFDAGDRRPHRAAPAAAPQLPPRGQRPAAPDPHRQRHGAGGLAQPPARPRRGRPARQLAGVRRAQCAARLSLPRRRSRHGRPRACCAVSTWCSRATKPSASTCSIACCRPPRRCGPGWREVPPCTSAAACRAWPSGVDAALRQIAGEASMRELNATGRYRRDVY